MKIALSQAPALQQHDSSGNITEEDYDHLKVDPYAVVSGAHGGGFEQHPSGKPHLRFSRGTLSEKADSGDYVLETRDEDVKKILKGSVGVVSLPYRRLGYVINTNTGKGTSHGTKKEKVQGNRLHAPVHRF